MRAAPRALALEVRLLGALEIRRDGVAVTLPGSRKVRALFTYLALAPRPLPRSQLCDLLWDVPNDPRGELRWCLSKIRGLVETEATQRVRTEGDAVALDLAGAFVDTAEVAGVVQCGIDGADTARLRAVAELFRGELAQGLELDQAPAFGAWLTAQRRHFRGAHAAILERLATQVPEAEALPFLERSVELTPYDSRVHERLLGALAAARRLDEGEAHLAATVKLFDAEGLDATAVRAAWRTARAARRPIIEVVATPTLVTASEAAAVGAPRRASVAVVPFIDASQAERTRGGIADALAHDVITRLAKLRSLAVIAQGSVFALHERDIGPEQAARMLGADYAVSGWIRREGERLTVSVELAETRTARVLWAETFRHALLDTFDVLDDIGNKIVALVASEIETAERNRAILKPPSSLDAWEAHHRGLWHMYRFNRADNDLARQFFETALRLDPTFARAYAGLSFTHFQSAFQGWGERDDETRLAAQSAQRSLVADDRDPAAHWAMGRALWLMGRNDEAVTELTDAMGLSPNFALGLYTLAFVHCQTGDAEAAITLSEQSRQLSPYDPLLFAMFASRGLALMRLGRFDEAAQWSVKAAARPNAHIHIKAIAAFALTRAGHTDEARAHLAALRAERPAYGIADFLSAFRFAPADERLFRDSARAVGM